VEHVELHVKDAMAVARGLKHYGGLFVGAGAAEVCIYLHRCIRMQDGLYTHTNTYVETYTSRKGRDGRGQGAQALRRTLCGCWSR